LLEIKPLVLSFNPNVSHLVELDTIIFEYISSPFESLTPTAFSSFKRISVTLALYLTFPPNFSIPETNFSAIVPTPPFG